MHFDSVNYPPCRSSFFWNSVPKHATWRRMSTFLEDMMYLWHRFKKPEPTLHVPDTNRKQPWWVILKYQLSCYCSLFVRLKRGHVSFTIKIISTMATWENLHSFIFVEFNLGALFTNSLGAAFNTAFGRDCKGRAQGDYFYGCQVRDIIIANITWYYMRFTKRVLTLNFLVRWTV